MTINTPHERARIAYLKRFGFDAKQPDKPDETGNIREWEGRQHIVLNSADGDLLAVYRIANDGQLRYMVRPPIKAISFWGYPIYRIKQTGRLIFAIPGRHPAGKSYRSRESAEKCAQALNKEMLGAQFQVFATKA